MLFNLLLAKDMVRRELTKIIKYVPAAGVQLVLFYAFLGLSMVFSLIPTPTQVVMILVLPLVKMLVKHFLWKFARQLDDLSTNVTVCMVEISCSLYQTLCLQLVNSIPLEVLIMLMDLVQAAVEVHTYLNHDYMSDGRTMIQTAISIVHSAVFPGADERPVQRSPRESSAGQVSRNSVVHSLSSLRLSIRRSVAFPQKPVLSSQDSGLRDSKLARKLKTKRNKAASPAPLRLIAHSDANANVAATAQSVFVESQQVAKHGLRRLLGITTISPEDSENAGGSGLDIHRSPKIGSSRWAPR